MNVLFLTDSLGYPREDPDTARGVDIWPYKVSSLIRKNRLSKNINLFFDAKPGLDTNSLARIRDKHIKAFQPDVIFIQVGIVDCYSRALTKKESLILSKLPILGKVTKYIVKKNYKKIVKFRNISYVNKIDFKRNLEYFRDGFRESKLVFIPIGPSNLDYMDSNPLIEQRINEYNQILKSISGCIFLEDLYHKVNVENLYLLDNHHLSLFGHQVVAQKVYNVLTDMIDDDTKWGS